jgi:hypothetical protein
LLFGTACGDFIEVFTAQALGDSLTHRYLLSPLQCLLSTTHPRTSRPASFPALLASATCSPSSST